MSTNRPTRDELLELAEEQGIRGAHYTASRDACGACRAADDEVMRSLDDPELVIPPNPACDRDECRCMLMYVMDDEKPPAGGY